MCDGVGSVSKAPVVSLDKKLYPRCLVHVLVGFKNGFQQDLTIKTFHYRQNQIIFPKCQYVYIQQFLSVLYLDN